ncbi:hypothetical protein K8F61_07680 [Microbacterium resistens]|uniref:Uncharacterized protein n=1 Tax=Microbacterium resistens TaxID=156977 RepID=A0ABY3RYB9_9MICO|nr:hypothetical protein [Microbacterium resistens]UGS28028.1 hypothetical protein K8F61_07680 [Microbacterium resistens]
MDLYFTPDIEVPIEYVTISGTQIACSYALKVEATDGGDTGPLRAWLRDHDWTGFGQKVYDDAMARPFVPDPQYPDEWTQQNLDTASWTEALERNVRAELPGELIPEGFRLHAASTCDGCLR